LEEFEEFEQEARLAYEVASRSLVLAYYETREMERVALEQEAERQAEAERQRKEREEQIAAAAVERARRQLEEEARRKVEEERQHAAAIIAAEMQRHQDELAEKERQHAAKLEQVRSEQPAPYVVDAHPEPVTRDHRAEVNRKAAEALAFIITGARIAEAGAVELAREIVRRIAKGEIPGISINY
jgi:hypothetical protein